MFLLGDVLNTTTKLYLTFLNWNEAAMKFHIFNTKHLKRINSEIILF